MGRSSTRARGRRRVLILVIGVAVVAAIALTVVLVRRWQLDRGARVARDEARAAFARGDYQRTLDQISPFLRRLGSTEATADDWWVRARAQLRVPLPNHQHKIAAMSNMARALAMDPARDDIRVALIELYVSTGRLVEAKSLVEAALERTPDDLWLLRTQCGLLEGLREPKAAVAVARRVVGLAPASISDAMRLLRLMVAAEVPRAEVRAWVLTTISERAQDVHFLMLRSALAALDGDDAQLHSTLDELVARGLPSTDSEFLRLLHAQLDAANRFDEALQVLLDFDPGEDRGIRVERLRRLLYAGKARVIVERPDLWDVPALRDDPEVLAVRVIALAAAGRADEAKAVRDTIGSGKDEVAAGWARLVAVRSSDPEAAAASIATFRDALKTVPQAALLWQALGDAYASIGEVELALHGWKQASMYAPSWSAPLRESASTMLALGDGRLAAATAQSALARAPSDAGALLVFVRAASSVASRLSDQEVQTIRGALDAMDRDTPEVKEALAPVRLVLLVATDPTGAAAYLGDVIRTRPSLSEPTLLQLAAIASKADLPNYADVLRECERAHGVTPGLALTVAFDVARARGVADGLAALESRAPAAGPRGGDVNWSVARATYLDATNRPEAGPAWIACSDEAPDLLHVQLGAIGCRAAWADPTGIGRVVSRLERLTGPTATIGRVARVRWMLMRPDPPATNLDEATALLHSVVRDAPTSVSARLLLAHALEMQGKLRDAETQLEHAARLRPNDTRLALDLARLAREQGRTDDARRRVDALLERSDVMPPEIERAAFIVAAAGDSAQGAALMEPLVRSATVSREGLVLLVRLYVELGEFERAADLCKSLLQKADAELVGLVADVYASAGRVAEADATIAMLESVDAQPGDRELAKARHAVRWAPAEAAGCFRAAVAAAPERSDAWIAFLQCALLAGDAAAFDEIVSDTRCVGIEPVAYFRSLRDRARTWLADPRLRPLLDAMVSSPPVRPAAESAIDVVSRAGAGLARDRAAVDAVVRIAESNPDVLPLQMLAAEALADSGRLSDGCGVAVRSAGRFSSSAPAAWQAAEMLAAAGRWQEALEVGRDWAQRSPRNDPRPRLLIARAQIQLDRAEDALTSLAPLVAPALAAPTHQRDVVLTYCIALVRAGRAADAEKVIVDLAGRFDAWKGIPLGVDPAWLGSDDRAAGWLAICDKALPAGDGPARLHLAQAWVATELRFPTPAVRTRAIEVVRSVAAAPGAPVEAHFLLASLLRRSGDLPGARQEYELVVRTIPKLGAAHNNLAMVLIDLGKYAEAIAEASSAVDAEPRNPAFCDTLASAFRRSGDPKKAVQWMNAAVEADPASLAWRVGLAESLRDTGDVNRLAETLSAIRTMVDDLDARKAAVPPDLRARIEAMAPTRR